MAAILDVFDTVNRFFRNAGGQDVFKISLISAGDDQSIEGYTLESIRSSAQKKLILIPAFNTENMQQAIAENQDYLPWIINQYQNGAEVATFCTGAFLLAASGLLNGKIATTHVDSCSGFANAFPAVNLKSDKTLTEDGRLYTSGGATSTFHLLLHLVQKYCGKDMSVRIAKFFAIDMDRDNQSYFGTFQPVRNHTDELVV